MSKYVLKRLLLMIPTIIGVILIVFSIMALTPGSPGKLILGARATPEAVEQLNEELGYNDPFLIRFADYVGGVVQGDFGISYNNQKPVIDEILVRFPTTLILAIFTVTGAALIGIPIGVVSAVRQYSIVDGLSTTLALLLACIPEFWTGLMLMLFFSLGLGWLPSSGIGTWQHFVLPIVTLLMMNTAIIVRITRTMMLETIRQDYIRTARAKGAGEKRVILRHALKNALLPVVTTLGMKFGSMLGGTILIESVFAMPGIGSLVVNAIRTKDIPQVMAAVIFLAITFGIIILVVDILYAFIDPRIKAKYVK